MNPTPLRDAEEPFRNGDQPIDLKLVDYWRWSGSILLDNVQRGVLAEFLVASTLDLTREARLEWGAYDLELRCGNGRRGIRIEVKSAAYLQSWPQDEDSRISFGIAPLKRLWDPKTNCTESLREPVRTADMYVFCHFKPRIEERESAEPLDVSQWDFFVVPTQVLDRERPGGGTIGLKAVKALGFGPTAYDELRGEIERIASELSDRCEEESNPVLRALDRVQASVRQRKVDLVGWERGVKLEREAIVSDSASRT